MEQLSARQIAADILAEAEKRYGGRERDDLTVAAAIIVKALRKGAAGFAGRVAGQSTNARY